MPAFFYVQGSREEVEVRGFMPIIHIGVECEDGSRHVHNYIDTFKLDSLKNAFDNAGKRHPNYLSMMTLKAQEVDDFLNFEWKDQE